MTRKQIIADIIVYTVGGILFLAILGAASAGVVMVFIQLGWWGIPAMMAATMFLLLLQWALDHKSW